MEPHEAFKTLGMFPAPDGNSEEQTRYLKEATEEFAEKLKGVSHKLPNDVWIATQTTIMKKLEYPMRATTLSRDQWSKVMAPLWQTALPHCGISRNFPRDVLYGPMKYQGMGAKDPWILQGLKHLEVLWEKTERNDVTGKLFSAEFEESGNRWLLDRPQV